MDKPDTMKHRYTIQGMTCNGCRSHVEEILSKVGGVTVVSVDLEKAEATIEMQDHIPIEEFQEALKNDGSRYSIHPHGESQHEQNTRKADTPKVQGTGTFYCPMHCEETKRMINLETARSAAWI